MTEQIGQSRSHRRSSCVSSRSLNDGPVRTEHFRAKYAGFWTRFWAYTIDLLVLSALAESSLNPFSGLRFRNYKSFISLIQSL